MMHQHIPPMDGQRTLTLAAFDALIEISLSQAADPLPGATARQILYRLAICGLAELSSTSESLTMRLYGVTASAHDGSALALLRNWQSAARDAVATQGARR